MKHDQPEKSVPLTALRSRAVASFSAMKAREKWQPKWRKVPRNKRQIKGRRHVGNQSAQRIAVLSVRLTVDGPGNCSIYEILVTCTPRYLYLA